MNKCCGTWVRTEYWDGYRVKGGERSAYVSKNILLYCPECGRPLKKEKDRKPSIEKMAWMLAKLMIWISKRGNPVPMGRTDIDRKYEELLEDE